MYELSRKPQGSSAAQASGEESGTPACVSDPPRGLEPSSSSAHLQRHKESPLTTQRDHTLVCKVFIMVFGRECSVCVLRKRRKKKIQSPQGLNKQSPPTTSVSPSDSHPVITPMETQCLPKTGVPFPALPHTVPDGQDLLRSVCVRGLIRGPLLPTHSDGDLLKGI